MTEFEKLFNDNRMFIFKYLIKLCGEASLAEELTQETFYRAYMNYASLRNKEKASVWLCTIARNTYYTWYHQQRNSAPLDDCNEISAPENIEESFIHKELTQTALLSLHELEEPYKEVFMLCVFGNFSPKDISKLFGKSESWARVTFYRAKQKLSERMREYHEL